MDVKDAIGSRRAYRSLATVEITNEMIDELAEAARLAPSCFNNQPWRFIFVHDQNKLNELMGALSSGNTWANKASMIIAIFSKKDLDCLVKDRVYYLFDTGMATAHIILRATELGLVAHPIAGFSPKKAKPILKIPDEMMLITLLIVGKKSDDLNPELSEKQRENEQTRPQRKPISEFVFLNEYGGAGD